MKEIGLFQRKEQLVEVCGKIGYENPVSGSLSKMHQRYNDKPNIEKPHQISDIHQQQIYPQYQIQQSQANQIPISQQNIIPKPQILNGIAQIKQTENVPFLMNNNKLEINDIVNKNNIILQNIQVIQDKENHQFSDQYPFFCQGILKQEENPDNQFAEALLVGPYHIIVLASQLKKLIVTSDSNITKRLYFQIRGQEINVKDFFMNSTNLYAIAILEGDVGTEFGYLGVINAKMNYYINLISQQNIKCSSLINISQPSQSYEVIDISLNKMKITCSLSNDSFQQDTLTNRSSNGWFLLKDDSLGYCVIGYCSENIISFINTSQVERWMSSIDEILPSENFSFVSSTKMEIKETTDKTMQKAHEQGIYKICRINHSTIVSSSCDNSIKFWNPFSNELSKNYKNDQCCRNFCISENQQYLYGTCDNYIFRMKWQQNYEIDKAFSCQEKIYCICLLKVHKNTGHDIIVSGDAAGNIYIIDGSTMQQINLISNSSLNKNGHNSSINSICRINDNQIATSGGCGQLKVWNYEERSLIKNLEGHNTQKSIYFVDKHPEIENQLITASSDQTIRVWDIPSGQQIKKVLVNNSIYCAGFLNEYELAVGDFNLIRIFNLRTWQYKKIEKHTCRINSICSLNERSFISGDIEGNMFIFNFDEEHQNQNILIEGIQGDSKLIDNAENNIQLNNTYKIVKPVYQNDKINQDKRMNTDADRSFERVENHSIRNPDNVKKYQYELLKLMKQQYPQQDQFNQRVNIQQHYSFGQQQTAITSLSTEQQDNPINIMNSKKPLVMYDRARQGSVQFIQKQKQNYQQCNYLTEFEIDQQQTSDQIDLNSLTFCNQNGKSNLQQFREIQSEQNQNNANNNLQILVSDQKDLYNDKKNEYDDNNFSINSSISIINPVNLRSQSEKKNHRRCITQIQMEPIKIENNLFIGKDDYNSPLNLNKDQIENPISNQGYLNPNNLTQSPIIAQSLVGSQIPIQNLQQQKQLQQQILPQIQQQSINQQQQQQQIMQKQSQPSTQYFFDKQRSSSVVKSFGPQQQDIFIPQSLNVSQNNGFQPQNFLNNNCNISNSSISNQSFQNLQIQNGFNQINQSIPNGGRVFLAKRSQSAARISQNQSISQSQLNVSQTNNNQNTSLGSIQGNNIVLNSINNIHTNTINNVINQKGNNNIQNILNPTLNPMLQNQHKQPQPTQLNYIQQYPSSNNMQNNLITQNDNQQSQNLYPTHNSNENLHKISIIAQGSKESFGQKLRSFARSPEIISNQQSLAPSPVLSLQLQNQTQTKQTNSINQYKPNILKERNQSFEFGQQNQCFKKENAENENLIKDEKNSNSFENKILSQQNEIQKLETILKRENDIIAQLSQEKSQMKETINQLKKEIDFIKQNQEKESKNQMDMIKFSDRLSELNSLNQELIIKIENFQEQENKNKQSIQDLLQQNNSLNECCEKYSKKNVELDQIIFSLRQQLSDRDQHILRQQQHIENQENSISQLTQDMKDDRKQKEEHIKNLKDEIDEKEKYIQNIFKNIGIQSINELQKQQFNSLQDKDYYTDINQFQTENNKNSFQVKDHLLQQAEQYEEITSKSELNKEGEYNSNNLKEKYKKIEIMASLRSAQDEVLTLRAQIQKLKQEHGSQIEQTDKYSQLNQSFKQKTHEVDNWRKIYNEIYEKQ